MGIFKKSITFSTALIFLTLCIFPAMDAALSTTSNQTRTHDTTNEEITIYRVDANGRTTPLQVSIKFEKGQNLDTAIAEKCKELCKNDKDMAQSIEQSGDWPFKINSSGNGTHRAFRRIIFPHRNVIWRLIIQYSYFSEDSYTTITNTKTGNEQSWNGPHSFRLTGFTGYINFKPFRLLGIRLFGSTIIQGYARGIEFGSPR